MSSGLVTARKFNESTFGVHTLEETSVRRDPEKR